jgi:hypothetical protein
MQARHGAVTGVLSCVKEDRHKANYRQAFACKKAPKESFWENVKA